MNLEAAELRAVKQVADEAGVSVAAWMRRAVLAALDAAGRTT